MDRALIIRCAYEMAKSTSLHELSIVRVARELGVTPALLHYYLGGRDALTSGVMNAFYRDMLERWPTMTGAWQHDVSVAAHHVYEAHVARPGIAAYVVSHNRFRMVQLVENGETDFGIMLFDRFMALFRALRFHPRRMAMWGHLIMEFIVSNAYATVRHRWPGEHGDFLRRVFAKLDPAEFPHASFLREAVVDLNAQEAFSEGLRLFLAAMDLEVGAQARAAKRLNR